MTVDDTASIRPPALRFSLPRSIVSQPVFGRRRSDKELAAQGYRRLFETRRSTMERAGMASVSGSDDGAASPLSVEMREVMSKRQFCHLFYVGRIAEVGLEDQSRACFRRLDGFPSASFAVVGEQGAQLFLLVVGGGPFSELANWQRRLLRPGGERLGLVLNCPSGTGSEAPFPRVDASSKRRPPVVRCSGCYPSEPSRSGCHASKTALWPRHRRSDQRSPLKRTAAHPQPPPHHPFGQRTSQTTSLPFAQFRKSAHPPPQKQDAETDLAKLNAPAAQAPTLCDSA